jgi:hypothetical protein
LAQEEKELTPMLRLSQKVRERLSQVKADRQLVDPKLGYQEATALLLVLQARELAFDQVLADLNEIQNGSEDTNKVLDFLGADDLPAYHDPSWRED